MMPLSEAQFQNTLIELLETYGYLVAHFRGGWSKDGTRFNTPVQGKGGVGFPDIVAVRENRPGKKGRVLFVECKSETGRLNEAQWMWAGSLSRAGAEYILARPQDYERLTEDLKK